MEDGAPDVGLGFLPGLLSLPCYVCDLERAGAKYTALRQAFEQHHERVAIAYSYKTNYVPALLRHLHGLGALAEVVSETELELSARLGLAGARVVFNGVGRSPGLLSRALASAVRVHFDGMDEIEQLARHVTGGPDRPRPLGLRVRVPLLEPPGPLAESRFGLAPDEVAEAARKLRTAGIGEVRALHAHVSSKRRDLAGVCKTISALIAAHRALGSPPLDYLDVGGGFGYAPPGAGQFGFPSFEEYAECIAAELRSARLVVPELVIEPGIALVGDCMSYFAPVTALKQIAGRSVAVIDASVHTIKPTRHRHNPPTRAFAPDGTAKHGSRRKAYDLVGYTCMEDDFIATGLELPELEVGDVLRLDNVGAYTLVFKPSFIRPMPAVYVHHGRFELARAGQSFDEFFAGYCF